MANYNISALPPATLSNLVAILAVLSEAKWVAIFAQLNAASAAAFEYFAFTSSTFVTHSTIPKSLTAVEITTANIIMIAVSFIGAPLATSATFTSSLTLEAKNLLEQPFEMLLALAAILWH